MTVPTTSGLVRETYDFTSATRWVSRLSMIGAVNMAFGSLRQFGIVHLLPDPPIDGFDSNAVIMSPEAFAALPDPRARLASAAVALALAGLAFGAMQLLDARRSA